MVERFNAPGLQHEAIARLIPHAGSMCLLDQLVAVSDNHIVCLARDHRGADHPLRSPLGLLATCLVEYAAQAMALHGAVSEAARLAAAGEAGDGPRPGFLASARGVQLACWRLDDASAPLRIEAQRLSGAGSQVLYGFKVADAHGTPLAEGRAAVVLNTPLAAAPSALHSPSP
jgi:predicted hotdog family 3-hydroxylacyl-ACP dehydratase